MCCTGRPVCCTGRPVCSRLRKEKKEVSVKFSLDWDSFTPFFDFDTDLNPATVADGISREKWSRDYFDNLKR